MGKRHVEKGRQRHSPIFLLLLILSILLTIPSGVPAAETAPSRGAAAQSKPADSEPTTKPADATPSISVKPTGGAEPVEITAERTEYLQGPEVYEADGKVVVVQGQIRLTADHITLMMLSGTMIATGHAHLTDPHSDLRAGRLELDINTEAGVVVNGQLFIRESNTLVTGRLLQRFSESHYRVKDGSFTNCDAVGGQTPAWRFRFKDLDLNVGEAMYANEGWFCVNDVPLIPFPTMSYPIQTQRKSGFLVPIAGWDNRFGFHYRQGYFWAINPSQDLTITPDILTNRGYGGDLEYRYALSGLSRGSWLMTYLQDTEINKARGQLTGYHAQQVTESLTIRSQAFLMTDRAYLNQLSNSGAQRALPSGDSYLHVNQRVPHGQLYLLGQFLQPVGVGGKDTFQRLPEIGYRANGAAPFGGPVLVGMESTYVNWFREEGFGFNRVDAVPELKTEMFSMGHMVGFTPRLKLRETYYTRNLNGSGTANRETLWASLEGTSRLSRRFRTGEKSSVLHTIEPRVIYEYVPPTDQSDIIKVDDVDDLPKKNLITYSLHSRLLQHTAEGKTNNWMNLLIAQSYRPGSTQSQAREFLSPIQPPFGTLTQSLQPATTAVQVKKFSDIWTRATFGNPVGPIRGVDQTLTVDAFFDPYGGEFSQWNTDLRFQKERDWYVELGQRHARAGSRVRRGDIWNPISFNEVFTPTPAVDFLTFGAAFRTPLGWTLGAQTYYDVRNGTSPETDVVALYRNQCQCWSLGLYYIKFPDRVQYSFMVSLTGIGANETFGTQLMKYILGPLVAGERGLPWPSPYGRRLTPQPDLPPME